MIPFLLFLSFTISLFSMELEDPAITFGRIQKVKEWLKDNHSDYGSDNESGNSDYESDNEVSCSVEAEYKKQSADSSIVDAQTLRNSFKGSQNSPNPSLNSRTIKRTPKICIIPKIDFSSSSEEETETNCPLLEASKDQVWSIVRSLLDKNKIELNNTCDEGRTALHYAAQAGKLDVVEALLDRGANHKIDDSFGNYPYDLLPEQLQNSPIATRLSW